MLNDVLVQRQVHSSVGGRFPIQELKRLDALIISHLRSTLSRKFVWPCAKLLPPLKWPEMKPRPLEVEVPSPSESSASNEKGEDKKGASASSSSSSNSPKRLVKFFRSKTPPKAAKERSHKWTAANNNPGGDSVNANDTNKKSNNNNNNNKAPADGNAPQGDHTDDEEPADDGEAASLEALPAKGPGLRQRWGNRVTTVKNLLQKRKDAGHEEGVSAVGEDDESQSGNNSEEEEESGEARQALQQQGDSSEEASKLPAAKKGPGLRQRWGSRVTSVKNLLQKRKDGDQENAAAAEAGGGREARISEEMEDDAEEYQSGNSEEEENEGKEEGKSGEARQEQHGKKVGMRDRWSSRVTSAKQHLMQKRKERKLRQFGFDSVDAHGDRASDDDEKEEEDEQFNSMREQFTEDAPAVPDEPALKPDSTTTTATTTTAEDDAFSSPIPPIPAYTPGQGAATVADV